MRRFWGSELHSGHLYPLYLLLSGSQGGKRAVLEVFSGSFRLVKPLGMGRVRVLVSRLGKAALALRSGW